MAARWIKKDLVALELGVAGRRDGCIGYHMQALGRLGATKQDVAEVLGMAVYMGRGGPSLVYAAEAIAAFEQLEAKARQ